MLSLRCHDTEGGTLILARMVDMVDLEAPTDLHKRGKVTIHFGELIISSDFDSGTKKLTGGGCEGGKNTKHF